MSSSNRRTAFARVPRGKNTDSATAPTATMINKQFLDRMTQARVAPDMATVLTKANAELSISIQPNGKGNFTVVSAGRVIGDSQDVQKVQSLGSFINDERKAIVKTSVSAIAKKTIAAIVQVSRDPAFLDEVPRPITRIDKSFVDIYRTVNAQAEMLNVNMQLVNATEANGAANERVRNHLLETGSRIREVLGKYLLYRAGIAEGTEAIKLNEFLVEGLVISWVFTRLCSQKMQLGGRDFEYRKVYFPKDPTKGLQVTYRELKTANLRNNQGGVLAGMGPYLGLWSDDMVRTLCGVPTDWDLNDFGQQAKVLSNVPFPVVPFNGAVATEEHFTILAQNGERGLPWAVGNTISPQDILKFIGTIPKRVAYGFIGRARFAAPTYETLFQGFHYEAAVIERDGRSVFNQLLNQFRAGQVNSDFFAIARGAHDAAQTGTVLSPLVCLVLDIPASQAQGIQVQVRFRTAVDSIPIGETSSTQDIWAAITTRRSMTDEACAGILNGILATNLDPRSKDARTSDIRSARSGLSVAGNSLVREFKRRNYHALGARVDQWLRSFLTTDLQASVAEVVAARLEASLATPIEFGRGDTAVFIEPAEFDVSVHNDEESVAEGDEAINPDDQ
jgi:hypothetical protein